MTMNSLNAITCPKCKVKFAPSDANGVFHVCRGCGRSVRIHLFPAILDLPEKAHVRRVEEDEAYCSTHGHDAWPATACCETCGRFICDLCKVSVKDKIVCTGCLVNTLKSTSQISEKEKKRCELNKRNLYIRTAGMWLLCSFMVPMLFLGSVFAIVYSIKAFKQNPPPYRTNNWQDKISAIVIIIVAILTALFGVFFVWGRLIYET